METCSSKAAAVIRSLKSELQRCRGPSRRPGKDEPFRKKARAAYTGVARRADPEVVTRASVLEQRALVNDPSAAWRKLMEYGAAEMPRACPHCRQKALVESTVSTRSVRQHVYMACKKCGCYTSVLFWSSFRGCRSNPGEVLDLLENYVSMKIMSRPTERELNRRTGLGRTACSSVVQILLKAGSLVALHRNRTKIAGRVLEGDCAAVAKTHTSTCNGKFKSVF